MGNCSSEMHHSQRNNAQPVRQRKVCAASVSATESVVEAPFSSMRAGVVGEGAVFRSDTGLLRQLLYTDYTASGRAHSDVETFVQQQVLPMYANTHSVASATAKQTTLFREEARAIIGRYYGCTEEDAAVFVGNGATGALTLFVKILERSNGFATREFSEGCDVLLDPISHHSSILPFRELSVERPDTFRQHTLALNTSTLRLCVSDLETRLRSAHGAGRRVVCVLSGGSNVTGLRPDYDEIERLAEKYQAVLCWDLAAVAGHTRFLFTSRSHFAFISPHKLLGGPGTSGVLLAKRVMLSHTKPCFVGGGCVTMVVDKQEKYITDVEGREEGGTPNIVADIKAGLVYRLHEQIDTEAAYAHELSLFWRLFKKLQCDPRIRILGEHQLSGGGVQPLPILSFNIVYAADARSEESAKLLHHNFVTALLNDLFGIQVRGGCACAGPYTMQLLRLTEKSAEFFAAVPGAEVIKPGFVRTGTHFTMTDTDVDFVAGAIRYIAAKGWLFLGAYDFDVQSGIWRLSQKHCMAAGRHPAVSDFGGTAPAVSVTAAAAARRKPLQQLVSEADEVLDKLHAAGGVSLNSISDNESRVPAAALPLVWFARPRDFVASLRPHARNGYIERLSRVKATQRFACKPNECS